MSVFRGIVQCAPVFFTLYAMYGTAAQQYALDLKIAIGDDQIGILADGNTAFGLFDA